MSLCWALCSGCVAALMPGVPAGPIAAPGIRAGSSYNYAYSRGTVHAVDPDMARVTVHGNSAMLASRYPSLLPAGPGLRVAPRSWLDLGAHLGLRQVGLQVRAGPLEAAQAVPWGVELEWLTGLGSLNSESLVPRRNVFRLRAEAYPALPFGRSESGAAYGFGVLALGVSTGTQLFTVNRVPDEYEESLFPALTGTSLDALHGETRLEAVLGLHWLSQPGAYTLAFLPWWRVHQGATLEAQCSGCSLQVFAIESSWGFGLALSGYLQAKRFGTSERAR